MHANVVWRKQQVEVDILYFSPNVGLIRSAKNLQGYWAVGDIMNIEKMLAGDIRKNNIIKPR